MAVRALWLLMLCAGCEQTVAQVTLKPQFSEVFVKRGAFEPVSTLLSTAPPDDGEQLFTINGSTLGNDESLLTTVGGGGTGAVANIKACKQLPVFWIPTRSDEVTPTTSRESTVCARMETIEFGGWKRATAELRLVADDADTLKVLINADHLVADALYSVWVEYASDATPADPKRMCVTRGCYAEAPLGGFPNLLVSDHQGHAHYERKIPARMLHAGSELVNGFSLGCDSPRAAPIIQDNTTLTFVLYYHSNGQSNGNASKTTKQLPRGKAVVIGQRTVDAHVHLAATMPVLR